MTLSSNPDEAWTICVHTTSRGDYDRAQEIAEAIEKAAKRSGAEDTMIEILLQERL